MWTLKQCMSALYFVQGTERSISSKHFELFVKSDLIKTLIYSHEHVKSFQIIKLIKILTYLETEDISVQSASTRTVVGKVIQCRLKKNEML